MCGRQIEIGGSVVVCAMQSFYSCYYFLYSGVLSGLGRIEIGRVCGRFVLTISLWITFLGLH